MLLGKKTTPSPVWSRMGRRKLLLGLALAGVVVVALAGAVVQLARGERPALLAA